MHRQYSWEGRPRPSGRLKEPAVKSESGTKDWRLGFRPTRTGEGACPHMAIADSMTQGLPNNAASAQLPTLAIVGRPNVDKSTLFTRFMGSRRAIVGDESGITRDRLYGEAHWRGRSLRIVDTGGIIPDEKDFIPAEVFRQAKVALEEADAVIMVVDGRTELAAPDLELARLLIRAGKPLFLAVNKIDTEKQQALAGEFHRLGIRKVFPISAEHGRGVDDLLDAVLAILPAEEK